MRKKENDLVDENYKLEGSYLLFFLLMIIKVIEVTTDDDSNKCQLRSG